MHEYGGTKECKSYALPVGVALDVEVAVVGVHDGECHERTDDDGQQSHIGDFLGEVDAGEFDHFRKCED